VSAVVDSCNGSGALDRYEGNGGVAMSRIHVVTDDNAFADQVAEALLTKLVQRLPGMLSSAQAEAERLMTPSEVRALKRCRLARVLDALAHGQLPATRRNTKGGKLGWFIRAADAARWNPDHQVLSVSTITKPPLRSDTELTAP
jgi:hypothetical protein